MGRPVNVNAEPAPRRPLPGARAPSDPAKSPRARSHRALPGRRPARAGPIGGAALAGLLCVTISAAPAAAEGETVRLSWARGAGADSCISAAALAERVEARLGRDAIAESAPRSIEGVVVREEERFLARIYIRDEGGALLGAREIDDASPSCSALDAAVVLAVALAIDPNAALAPPRAVVPTNPPPTSATPPPASATPPPSPSTLPPSQSGAPSAEPQEPRPAAIPAPSAAAAPPFATPLAAPQPPPPARAPTLDPLFVASTVRVLFASGLLPSGALGFSSAAEVGAGRLRGTAGLLWFPEVDAADGSFSFGLAAGSLGGCVDPHVRSTLRLGLCAGALAGAFHAVTRAVTPTNPGDRAWVAASVAGRAELRLAGPLIAHTSLEAVIPITRYRFVVLGREAPVFEPPPVAAIAAVGLGVMFP